MRRTLWMVVSLVAVGVWLVLSYMPGVALPALAYPAWSGPLLALAAAAGLLLFLAIQAWIVRATDRAIAGGGKAVAAELGVARGREIIWTALPIVMTLALAAASAGLWRALW